MGRAGRVTIADIAARAGISPGAVSFALNGRPGVSDETRARVRAIAAELDWRPHSAATALSASRAGVVGFVVNRPARFLGTEAFFGDLIAGMQLGLAETRTALTLLIASDLEDELTIYREWHSTHRVDGVVLIDPRVDDPRPALLRRIGLPAVVIGSHPSPPDEPPAVWIDDASAATMLMEYLYAIGHRHVAHVTGTAVFEHTALRWRAVEQFAAAAGMPAPVGTVTDYTAESGARATRRLLSSADRPSAILYDSDVLAVAGLGVAQEMGFAVPGDVSLVSFDDSIMTRLVRPALTTLTRDTVQLGRLAAVTLLEAVSDTAPLASRPGPELSLTVRESTAPPRATTSTSVRTT